MPLAEPAALAPQALCWSGAPLGALASRRPLCVAKRVRSAIPGASGAGRCGDAHAGEMPNTVRLALRWILPSLFHAFDFVQPSAALGALASRRPLCMAMPVHSAASCGLEGWRLRPCARRRDGSAPRAALDPYRPVRESSGHKSAKRTGLGGDASAPSKKAPGQTKDPRPGLHAGVRPAVPCHGASFTDFSSRSAYSGPLGLEESNTTSTW